MNFNLNFFFKKIFFILFFSNLFLPAFAFSQDSFEDEIDSFLESENTQTEVIQEEVKPNDFDKVSFVNAFLLLFSDSLYRPIFLWSLILSIFVSIVGIWVILRKTVFYGLAVSQTAAAGVAFGLIFDIAPEFSAIGATICLAIIYTFFRENRRVTEEVFLAIFYILASSLTVLLISSWAQGEKHIVEAIFGNFLTIRYKNPIFFFCISVFFLILQFIFIRPLIRIFFNPVEAKVTGIAIFKITLFFNIAQGIVIALAIQLAGALTVLTMLVIPASMGLYNSRNFITAFIKSVGWTILFVSFGFVIAIQYDLPASGVVSVLSTIGWIFFMIIQRETIPVLSWFGKLRHK